MRLWLQMQLPTRRTSAQCPQMQMQGATAQRHLGNLCPQMQMQGARAKTRRGVGEHRTDSTGGCTKWPLAKAERKAARLKSERDVAVAVANPSVARRISQEVFGFAGGPQNAVASGLTIDPDSAIAVCKRRQNGRNTRRGIVSHIKAQQARLQQCLAGARALIHTDVMDDATMWVKQHTDARQRKARQAQVQRNKEQRRNLAKGRPGRNKAIAIMNNVQHVYVAKPAGARVAWNVAQVHSPAQALPKGNWATVYDRKRRWNVCSGGQVGRSLRRKTDGELDNTMQDAVDATPAIIQISTNDAAGVNECVTHIEQHELIARRGDGRYRLHLDLHCQGHQGCLVTRPVYESAAVGDLATIIVRLGHILEGAKNMDLLLKASDAVIDDIFEYRPVHSLPAEANAWRQDAQWVLESSKAAGDLSDKVMEAKVQHDNCDWKGARYIHDHKIGDCPSGCTGEDDGKEKAKMLTRAGLATGCPIGLLYRWKHMDAAQAFLHRGRGEHEILPLSLQRMWSKTALDEAALVLEMANNVDELSFATRAAAKASSVLRFLDADIGGRLLMRGVMITAPAHRYVNRVQRADKASCALARAMAANPTSAATRDAKTACQRINYHIIT